MTAYATRSPLQALTNTYHIMAEPPSSNRRTSARLKFKEDVLTTSLPEKSKPTGTTKQTQGTAKVGTNRSKRKIDYDENDNGFKFTRSQPKRVKATSIVSQGQSESRPEVAEEKPAPRKGPRKTSPEPADNIQTKSERTQLRRVVERPSDQQQATNSAPLALTPQKTRRSPRKSVRHQDQAQHEVEKESETSGDHTVSNEPTKIALPFVDTPVIRRNKEMRKGKDQGRRSSLSLRGRRASSLIESGTSSALPHEEVDTVDFYKHIESSVPEPRRMRQLLVWCGSRAMGKKPSFATEDSEVTLAAWQIQQELFKDFSGKSELFDWYSREETSQSKTLRPNPRNIANLAKIEELEIKLKALRAEQEEWSRLRQPPDPAGLALAPLPPIESLSISSLPRTTMSSSASLEKLLNSKYTPSTELTSSIQHRLEAVTTDFELNLDRLLDSVNKIGQHLAAAESTSKHVLGSVAKVLDDKDRLALDKDGSVGMMDTLRALTRVIDRN